MSSVLPRRRRGSRGPAGEHSVSLLQRGTIKREAVPAGAPQPTEGFNFYSYVGSKPVNRIDPFGLEESPRQFHGTAAALWLLHVADDEDCLRDDPPGASWH